MRSSCLSVHVLGKTKSKFIVEALARPFSIHLVFILILILILVLGLTQGYRGCSIDGQCCADWLSLVVAARGQNRRE